MKKPNTTNINQERDGQRPDSDKTVSVVGLWLRNELASDENDELIDKLIRVSNRLGEHISC